MKAGRWESPDGLLKPKCMGQKSLLSFFENQDLGHILYFIDQTDAV